VILAPAVTTSVGPYAAVMAAGFLIGIIGHINRSRTLILTGILIVGGVSAYFAFVVGKLT
jgi:hypothetical protein